MRRRHTTLVSALSITALGLAALATGAAPAGASPQAAASPTPRSIAPLSRASGQDSARLGNDDPSGSARSLTVAPGAPLARPSRVSASAAPAEIAKAVVVDNSVALATRGAAFAAQRTLRATGGGSIVHLQQTVAGVPVLGGEAVVALDSAGRTLSASAETLPGAAPTTAPAIPAALATQRALSSVALSAKAPLASLVASKPSLAIYDPRIFGADGLQRANLTWRVTVRSTTDTGINHLVLIDAAHGIVTLDLDQLNDALNRTVCDANGLTAEVPCTTPGSGGRIESGPVSTVPDVNRAYDYAGATYDFYKNRLGRDSVDNLGLTLTSTVNYCPLPADGDCPFENAYWDGTQMVYGHGFANADDVVAHELTHGVTQYTNGLFYFFQSGAINESLSDIFGEYVDQTDRVDGAGGTLPAKKWLMGEDLPPLHPGGGVVILTGSGLRNMANPHAFGQPDRMGDTAYYETHGYLDGASFDNGGVHTNSGVGNKLGYLIGNTKGASVTFNGRATVGLGIPVAAEIVYGASQRLTSGADYRAFATALRSSCAYLVSNPGEVAPVASADCVQVNNAILATQMDLQPTAVGSRDAATCPVGQVTTTAFADDMEVAASGNWTPLGTSVTYSPAAAPSTTKSGRLWFHGTDVLTNPYGSANQYSTSGTGNWWGDDPDLLPGGPFTTTPAHYDAQLVMTDGVTVPAGGFLRFEHAFGFGANGLPTGNKDGGRVEYTIDDGVTWRSAGPLMAATGDNGYGFNVEGGAKNSVLASGNLLAGAAAFTRHSQGYVATRANLASLAGKTVKFRFRITTDQAGGDYGWFIDDVKIYSCSPLLPVSNPPATVFAAVPIRVGSNDVTAHQHLIYKTGSASPGKPIAWGTSKELPPSRVIPVVLPSGGGSTCVAISAYTSGKLITTATRCETLPVDDRALRRSGTWRLAGSSASYASTLSTSTRWGSKLTLPSARGSRLVIVAERVRGGGTIGVYVAGKRVATVSLDSSSIRYKQIIDLAVRGLTGGPVTLRVESSGKPVNLDAVGVRP